MLGAQGVGMGEDMEEKRGKHGSRRGSLATHVTQGQTEEQRKSNVKGIVTITLGVMPEEIQ